jgi:hypothetical protein
MTGDGSRLIALAVATATKLLDANRQAAFVGAYHARVAPHPLARARSTAGPAARETMHRVRIARRGETIFVPLVITRSLMRGARVTTYAPIHHPGRSIVLARGSAPGGTGQLRQGRPG